MKRVITCLFAGAMAMSLNVASAQAQEETAAPESKPVPIADVAPADYVDFVAEDKDGNVMGIIFDVVLNDSGKAKTLVVELFEETNGVEGSEEPAEDAADEGNDEGAEADDGEIAAQDTVEDEPEPEGDVGEGEEGDEEAMMVGKLVGISPKGAMVDTGRGVVTVASTTAAQVEGMKDFEFTPGVKTLGHPDGYPAE